MSTARKFARVLAGLCVLTLGLMALGAGVRAKKAGLTCPDWPLCFGKIIPDYHPGVYFEFIHRSYAGLVSILFFCCLIYSWRSKDRIVSSVRGLLAIAAVMLLAQILMGGLTVLKLVKIEVVTSHLALATLFFACIYWSYLNLKSSEGRDLDKSRLIQSPVLRIIIFILPVLVFSQLVMGGLVASSYAGSVCVDFPTCNGQWIPQPFTGPIELQVLHRFVAYFLFFFVLTVGGLILRATSNAYVKKSTGLMMLAVFVQVCLGITNVVLIIPFYITVAHHLVGILLFASTLRLLQSQS